MIEVRVRHIDEADALHLGYVDFTEESLTRASRLLDHFGFEPEGSIYDTHFVIDHPKSAAYFEIIVQDA